MSATAQDQVRRGDPGDAGQLAVIHVRTWPSAYRSLLPQDFLDGPGPASGVEPGRRILAEAGPVLA
jgi:hypothetical protein